MKSRLVILTMLVFGMLLSTAGAGLAISGVTGNAAQTQYPKSETPTPGPGGGVLGDQDDGAGENVSPSDNEGGGGTNPTDEESGDTQPSRQVEAGQGTDSGELPFTGFAAIPILFGGLVLLGGGLVLRSRASEH